MAVASVLSSGIDAGLREGCFDDQTVKPCHHSDEARFRAQDSGGLAARVLGKVIVHEESRLLRPNDHDYAVQTYCMFKSYVLEVGRTICIYRDCPSD